MPFRPAKQCANGHGKHDFFIQDDASACGIAVLAMIVKKKFGIELTEDLVRTNGLASPTTLNEMLNQLQHYGITTAVAKRGQIYTELKSHVRAAKPSRPVLAPLIWEGMDYGHWILIDGRKRNWGRSSDYCICDPVHGVVQTSLSVGAVQVKGKTQMVTGNGLVYNAPGGAVGLLYSDLIIFSEDLR